MKIGEVAQQLGRRLARDRHWRAMQLVERRHPVLRRLDNDLVAHTVLVVQPEVCRRRAAAGQRDQQAVGDVSLGQADLLGERAVGIDHDPRRVEDLLHMDVHRAGNPSEVCGDLLRHAEIRARFRYRARDLDVDRRGQTEVEDLTDDIGGLREEFQIREPTRQLSSRRVFKYAAVG